MNLTEQFREASWPGSPDFPRPFTAKILTTPMIDPPSYQYSSIALQQRLWSWENWFLMMTIQIEAQHKKLKFKTICTVYHVKIVLITLNVCWFDALSLDSINYCSWFKRKDKRNRYCEITIFLPNFSRLFHLYDSITNATENSQWLAFTCTIWASYLMFSPVKWSH